MERILSILNNSQAKVNFLRICIGVVYLWFGGLKLFSGLSPAELIAKETIQLLTFDLLNVEVAYLILAIWEITIGTLLVFNIFCYQAVYLALIHLIFTFVPLFAFATDSFQNPPFTFSLLGQYIFKNIVLISGLLVVLPTKKKVPISSQFV